MAEWHAGSLCFETENANIEVCVLTLKLRTQELVKTGSGVAHISAARLQVRILC
jgi:hypothetical protein